VLARLPEEHEVAFSVRTMHAQVLAPDVALVRYGVERAHLGQFAYSLRSSVWVKGAGGWKMRYHQGTSVSELPPNNWLQRTRDR
jgi:hypothetical protein